MNSQSTSGFDRKTALLIVAFLSVAGVVGRLLPHEPNATPTVALGLVAGAALGRRFALFVPLGVMLVSDLVLGTYAPLVMVSVYACLALPVFVGRRFLGERRSVLSIGISALTCSIVFFVVTNFAVWAAGDWYEPNVAGLLSCYASALPFARNMMASDLIWSFALFAGLSVAEKYALSSARNPLGEIAAD